MEVEEQRLCSHSGCWRDSSSEQGPASMTTAAVLGGVRACRGNMKNGRLAGPRTSSLSTFSDPRESLGYAHTCYAAGVLFSRNSLQQAPVIGACGSTRSRVANGGYLCALGPNTVTGGWRRLLCLPRGGFWRVMGLQGVSTCTVGQAAWEHDRCLCLGAASHPALRVTLCSLHSVLSSTPSS